MRNGTLDDSFMGPAIYTEGEDLVNEAWDMPPGTRRQSKARKALTADLDNIDAYVLLALDAKSLGERLALLREAVRVGERLWAPTLQDSAMQWWGYLGTRPWMRALHLLGLALEEAGDTDEAEALFRRLLVLNPNDNQGVRSGLIRCLMLRRRIGDLRAVLKSYPEDALIETSMAGLWLALRLKSADMAKLGPPVDQRNPHVLAMLAGQGPKPEEIEALAHGVVVGGADEAAAYVQEFAAIWAASPSALTAIATYVAGRPAPETGCA